MTLVSRSDVDEVFSAIDGAMMDIVHEVKGEKSKYDVFVFHEGRNHFALPKYEPILYVRKKGLIPAMKAEADRIWNGVPEKSPLIVVPWVNNSLEDRPIDVWVIPSGVYVEPARRAFEDLASEYNLNLRYHNRVSAEFDRTRRLVADV